MERNPAAATRRFRSSGPRRLVGRLWRQQLMHSSLQRKSRRPMPWNAFFGEGQGRG